MRWNSPPRWPRGSCSSHANQIMNHGIEWAPGRSARLARWLALVGVALAGQAFARPAVPGLDTMEQRMRPCAACHGESGRATSEGFFPRIAGKPAGYLYHQLLNFRDGRRQHAQMTYLVERQGDSYLRQMAEHFAALDLPYPPATAGKASAEILARGEVLNRRGDAARDLPACAACHGEALTGLQPAVPGLLGLPYDYLVAQLGAWQQGVRKAKAPDCMAQIAQKLEPAEIEAVAAWLAAQAVPSPSRAPQGKPASTLPCGSAKETP